MKLYIKSIFIKLGFIQEPKDKEIPKLFDKYVNLCDKLDNLYGLVIDSYEDDDITFELFSNLVRETKESLCYKLNELDALYEKFSVNSISYYNYVIQINQVLDSYESKYDNLVELYDKSFKS